MNRDCSSEGTLSGQGVILRRVTGDDAPFVVRWRNDPEIANRFFSTATVTAESHRAWCEQNGGSKFDFTFLILARRGDIPVGMVAIYNVDRERRMAEFGRLLIGEPEYRGRGLAKDAARTVLRFAFRELGLDEIYLDVWGVNGPAITLYEALGFARAPMKVDLETGREVLRMQVDRARFEGNV